MRRLLAVSFLLFCPLSTYAADWPQFLGPTRDSVSAEKVEPWKESPKALWKQPVGDGHSSPVVADGVVYSFFQPKGKDADALAAFDAKTGDKKWEKSYDRVHFKPPFGEGPRGTPAVANGKVFTFGGTGVLACWDAKTGDVVWQVDTLKQYGAKNLFFGISTSPTVVGDKVVVMVGGKGHGIVAFNVADGKEAWAATDDPASYASPLPVKAGDATELLFLTGSNLRSITADGKPRWEVPFKDKLNESSTTPVKVGDVVVAGSVTAGSIAVKPDSPTPTPVWKEPTLTCYFSTPVAVGPHLYMVNGAVNLVNPSIVLRCVETATGKVLWSKDKVGKYHAALIRTANDKLLMLDDGGNLVLLEPGATEYKELSRSKVCGDTWAHPALANGCVFVRDNRELICVKLGG